jgi:hypothetical protein
MLVFAFTGALVADVVEAFPQDFNDFAVLFAPLFINQDMAFGFACFVVGGQPGTGGRRGGKLTIKRVNAEKPNK